MNVIAKAWTVAAIVAFLAVIFPPRRDTDQGRDRDSISRGFLWSRDLYKGSKTVVGFHVARIDHQKLALELIATAIIGGGAVLASRRKLSGG